MPAFFKNIERRPLMAVAATALVLALVAPIPASTQAVPDQFEGMVNEDIRRFWHQYRRRRARPALLAPAHGTGNAPVRHRGPHRRARGQARRV